MRIGSKFISAGLFGLAAFIAASEAGAAGAGAIGGGFGPGVLGGGGGLVVGRGGFVGGGYGYRGRHHHGWRGPWARGPHRGHWGQRRYGYGQYGYGYGGGAYAYGGGGYPAEPPAPPQPVVGIPPSPVLPPAIYVIGGKTKGAAVRKGARTAVSASSYKVRGQSSGVVVTRVTPGGFRMN